LCEDSGNIFTYRQNLINVRRDIEDWSIQWPTRSRERRPARCPTGCVTAARCAGLHADLQPVHHQEPADEYLIAQGGIIVAAVLIQQFRVAAPRRPARSPSA
jgi:hypothetical protein